MEWTNIRARAGLTIFAHPEDGRGCGRNDSAFCVAVGRNSLANPFAVDVPAHPQTIGAILVQEAAGLHAVKVDLVCVAENPEFCEVQLGISAPQRIKRPGYLSHTESERPLTLSQFEPEPQVLVPIFGPDSENMGVNGKITPFLAEKAKCESDQPHSVERTQDQCAYFFRSYEQRRRNDITFPHAPNLLFENFNLFKLRNFFHVSDNDFALS